MNEFGLLIVSGMPVMILGALLVWSWRRISLLGTLIVGATLVHEIILILFPVWYSVFTSFRLEGYMYAKVGADDLLRVMTGESVFVLMFALAFIIGCPRLRPQTGLEIRPAFGKNQARRVRLVLNILIVVGFLVYGSTIIHPVSTLQNDTRGTLDQLLLWFQTIFGFTSLVACALVLTRHKVLFKNRVQALMAAIPLLILLVLGLSIGVRGRIMWVVSLLVVAGIMNRQAKFVVLGIIIAIAMIPLFAFFGSAFRLIDKSGIKSGEMYSRLYQEGKARVLQGIESVGDEFLYAVALRAQGPRNSAVLYQQYDNGNGAGFKTYLGSIFFPIPRLVWPEKPWAGGTDETSTSSAIYKAMEWSYGYERGPGGTMGPILASAHAYWEGGWGWLVVAGFITGLIWNKIFKLCRRIPEEIAAVVALAFAAALLIDGMLTMLTPLYAIIIAGWQSVLPVVIIYRGTIMFFANRSVTAGEAVR